MLEYFINLFFYAILVAFLESLGISISIYTSTFSLTIQLQEGKLVEKLTTCTFEMLFYQTVYVPKFTERISLYLYLYLYNLLN